MGCGASKGRQNAVTHVSEAQQIRHRMRQIVTCQSRSIDSSSRCCTLTSEVCNSGTDELPVSSREEDEKRDGSTTYTPSSMLYVPSKRRPSKRMKSLSELPPLFADADSMGCDDPYDDDDEKMKKPQGEWEHGMTHLDLAQLPPSPVLPHLRIKRCPLVESTCEHLECETVFLQRMHIDDDLEFHVGHKHAPPVVVMPKMVRAYSTHFGGIYVEWDVTLPSAARRCEFYVEGYHLGLKEIVFTRGTPMVPCLRKMYENCSNRVFPCANPYWTEQIVGDAEIFLPAHPSRILKQEDKYALEYSGEGTASSVFLRIWTLYRGYVTFSLWYELPLDLSEKDIGTQALRAFPLAHSFLETIPKTYMSDVRPRVDYDFTHSRRCG
jgi:hypothetical protein